MGKGVKWTRARKAGVWDRVSQQGDKMRLVGRGGGRGVN
jgi:hypothetical protein